MRERMEYKMELNNISSKRNDSDRTNLDLSPLAIAAINLGDDIDGWEEHCCLRNTILEDEDIIWNGTDISDSVDEFSEEGQYNEDSLKYLYQMPSIFDGLNSATDDDIRFLIAQFENITTDNIINIYSQYWIFSQKKEAGTSLLHKNGTLHFHPCAME